MEAQSTERNTSRPSLSSVSPWLVTAPPCRLLRRGGLGGKHARGDGLQGGELDVKIARGAGHVDHRVIFLEGDHGREGVRNYAAPAAIEEWTALAPMEPME